jgi:hypothetical protein
MIFFVYRVSCLGRFELLENALGQTVWSIVLRLMTVTVNGFEVETLRLLRAVGQDDASDGDDDDWHKRGLTLSYFIKSQAGKCYSSSKEVDEWSSLVTQHTYTKQCERSSEIQGKGSIWRNAAWHPTHPRFINDGPAEPPELA